MESIQSTFSHSVGRHVARRAPHSSGKSSMRTTDASSASAQTTNQPGCSLRDSARSATAGQQPPERQCMRNDSNRSTHTANSKTGWGRAPHPAPQPCEGCLHRLRLLRVQPQVPGGGDVWNHLAQNQLSSQRQKPGSTQNSPQRYRAAASTSKKSRAALPQLSQNTAGPRRRRYACATAAAAVRRPEPRTPVISSVPRQRLEAKRSSAYSAQS
jgi:hypothetical protein